jgi:hypothetical protein
LLWIQLIILMEVEQKLTNLKFHLEDE